jgi:hypothetical protein
VIDHQDTLALLVGAQGFLAGSALNNCWVMRELNSRAESIWLAVPAEWRSDAEDLALRLLLRMLPVLDGSFILLSQ